MENDVLTDFTDIPDDDLTTDVIDSANTFMESSDIDFFKEILVWIFGTNVIIIACLLIIAFFVGKSSA